MEAPSVGRNGCYIFRFFLSLYSFCLLLIIIHRQIRLSNFNCAVTDSVQMITIKQRLQSALVILGCSSALICTSEMHFICLQRSYYSARLFFPLSFRFFIPVSFPKSFVDSYHYNNTFCFSVSSTLNAL